MHGVDDRPNRTGQEAAREETSREAPIQTANLKLMHMERTDTQTDRCAMMLQGAPSKTQFRQ